VTMRVLDIYYLGEVILGLLTFLTMYLGSGEDRLSAFDRFKISLVIFTIYTGLWTILLGVLWILLSAILGG